MQAEALIYIKKKKRRKRKEKTKQKKRERKKGKRERERKQEVLYKKSRYRKEHRIVTPSVRLKVESGYVTGQVTPHTPHYLTSSCTLEL